MRNVESSTADRSIRSGRSLRRRASLQAHASGSNATQQRRNKKRGNKHHSKRIQAAAYCNLLQALKKQEMHVCLRHRKPASACVREQHNTKEGKQTARRKRHSKRSQAAAYCKLCQNPADARLRALVCSSQPAAVRNVESSTSSSEAAALCDVTATTRKPATQRMSQGATQHKRGKTDGEENSTIPNAPLAAYCKL